MKKIYLSLGAIALAGVVLASCSSNTGIKTPNKGKKVDKVSFTEATYGEIEITNETKAEDVCSMFEYYIYPTVADLHGHTNIKGYYNSSYKYEATNVLRNGTLNKKLTTEYTSTSTYDMYMRDLGDDNSTGAEIYAETKGKEYSSSTSDKESRSSTDESYSKYAGSYIEKNDGTRTIDYGKHVENKETEKVKDLIGSSNTTYSNKSTKYLNASEKPSDENYNKYYYGKDADGQVYSYSISSFFDGESQLNYESISLDEFYTESMAELYDISFELTDKYIIIKSESIYSEEIADFVLMKAEIDGKEITESNFVSEYKDALNKYFKGSKSTYEIWLNYTNNDESHPEYKRLGYAYYKAETTTKGSYTLTYDDAYIKYLGYDDEYAEKVKGKKTKNTESGKYYFEVSVGEEDYAKKIKSAKQYFKKNNIFDKIKMTCEGVL